MFGNNVAILAYKQNSLLEFSSHTCIHPVHERTDALPGSDKQNPNLSCWFIIQIWGNSFMTFSKEKISFGEEYVIWHTSFQIPPPASLLIIRGCGMLTMECVYLLIYFFFNLFFLLARLIILRGYQITILESKKLIISRGMKDTLCSS